MTDPLAVLGVRHHGPGSARALRKALDELGPAAVVIEGPPELDKIVELAADPAMVPPVAGLVYDVAAPRRATFYPMASFSPEWVALRWAQNHEVPVRFADLPAANRLAGTQPASPDGDSTAEADTEPSDRSAGDQDPVGHDPIAALAEAAGYDDPERWWEDAIEQRSAPGDPIARFDAVREAMAQYRADFDDAELDRDQLLVREASMRKILRSVAKAATGPVAVVCGAFHAPVLHPDAWPTATADNATLKGLAKTKVAATWAPWTSGRLALNSGYGAGVVAPRWYEHLFATSDDDEVVARWMVRVARLLRDQGHDASSASAVEATRMAETLAALRGRPVAGLAEVSDAALTVLGQGSPLVLDSISGRLFIGADLGQVPATTPMVPLAEDLARQQRSRRLKPSPEPKTIVLDLRKPAQRERSVLLRRLRLLGVEWGAPTATGRTEGTFKEAWIVEWQPELAVTVIEASLYGTTIESAATAKVAELADRAASLTELAELVEACLPAELTDALEAVLATMADRTATAPDQLALMGAVEPLARTRRYGNVRGVDTGVVHEVLDTIVDRAAIGLAGSCVSLDDGAAATMRTAIESVDRGVALVGDDRLVAVWRDALAGLSTSVHGSVAGLVARILLDSGRLDLEAATGRLHRALSPAVAPAVAAAWLDGFLAGDVALLLHDPTLFGLIDEWLCGLDEVDFEDLLALVRRTFARFEPAERRDLGELVKRGRAGDTAAVTSTCDLDPARATAAIAHLADLLGLARTEAGQ